jgi:glycosyltransferase involved in cell wall biosynthesis
MNVTATSMAARTSTAPGDSRRVAPVAERKVSLLLPCRDEVHSIEKCVRSLMAQRIEGFDLELIVADGNSQDGTQDTLQRLRGEFPQLSISKNAQGIASTGLNAAIRASSGEVLVRVDAHTEYAQDYVQECVTALNTTSADNVGGPARTVATGYVAEAIRSAYHSPFAIGGARFHRVDFEGYVDTVPYGCWRRSTFDRIGLFDEELVRNQDDEHNLRIRRSGGKIWQSPRIVSWYRPRASLKQLFWQYWQYGYWKVRVIQKHRLPASPRHLVPGSMVGAVGLLSSLSLASTTARCLLALILGAYAAFLAIGTLVTCWRNRASHAVVLPLVFLCFHWGYGAGFLLGIWDFVICRRSARPDSTRLTRGPVDRV